MENGVVENGVCSSEAVDGSRDVWSCKTSDSASADHLVIMANGILGSVTDWKFAAEKFVETLPDKVFVHCSERNVSRLTLDGVDVMGERLAEEVLEVIQRKPNLNKISFVAHSVGGLVARYAIGKLYRPPKSENVEDSSISECSTESTGTIGGLEAMNFITVATPHLGSRGNKQVPFLFGIPVFERAASFVIHLIFRRTGRHLFLNDDDGGKPPLLKRMIEDQEDCYFMSALRAFKRRVAYSNVGSDHIVGWRTSSIRRDSELPKWEDVVNEKYPHIVYEERCKGFDAEQSETSSMEDDGSDKIEEELVTGLSRLSWEKVDVSFHSSSQRFAAHSIIQVEENQSSLIQNPIIFYLSHLHFPTRSVFRDLHVLLSSIKGFNSNRFLPRIALQHSFHARRQLIFPPNSTGLRGTLAFLKSSMELKICCAGGFSKSSPSYPLSPPPIRSKPQASSLSTSPNSPLPFFKARSFVSVNSGCRKNKPIRSQSSDFQTANNGFVLEDVPHLTNFLTDLPSYPNPLQRFQAYGIVEQAFVSSKDVVAEKIVVQKDSPRGVHFRRAGPREKVYFKSEEVRACIVTCGGLCPGINTVIREVVCGLNYMYDVEDILGIEGGYKGFYSKNTLRLTPKVVNDIHKRGGTFLRTSRGGHDTHKIVDNIQDRGINQVYIIGGDGTQRGAALIYEEVKKRGLQVAVAGIPKTIDNDIAVIDKSFGFDTAVEEAQRAINAAHVEVESVENGVGIVKLMGRYSGFIAMYATLASRDVDCCLIPESPFFLEGKGGLFEFMERRLKENGHMVIVLAEGAGQEYVAKDMQHVTEKDASGNRLLLDAGFWLSEKIKNHFTKVQKMAINLKYIDPTYMIRAIPGNASDNIYCTLLAHSAVHGAMAGYSGFTVGPVNGKHAYIPISRVTEVQKTVNMTDRMWARLLASTNQPSFLDCKAL
ncbi:hypothetical protein FNV43_RR24293 [Rhamnella rubrinervis]|uniref:ATP-dependent 6-phosphofructokinase n=1 Tax=Rhamnella rubrinervis TaxID=2594499 RepID=A0A8K0DMI1_9ROSA|nr:hypothetical protein FNV43_RR24293 [Rhamnella rubrinervis]